MHDLYFTGGTSSFAHHFKRQFPTHESSNGELLREVPIPMVALVATAVSVVILGNQISTQY